MSFAASIFDRFSIPFFINFWSVLGAILGRKIDQKSTKNGFEMRPPSRSIFGRFFFDFGVQRFYADVGFTWVKLTIFNKSAFEEDVALDFDFGAYLAPFRLQKSTKIEEKASSKWDQIFDRF